MNAPISRISECSIDGCVRTVRARSWCPTHYSRWERYGDPLESVPIADRGTTPLEVRYWQRVIKDGPVPDHAPELGNCWGWQGTRHGDGYGTIGNRGAHRISWVLHFGPIPEGMFVCHRCDNPPCSRPDHLFLGDAADNNRDMFGKGRHRATRYNAEKTHCKRGHEFTPHNTYIHEGQRSCQSCKRLRPHLKKRRETPHGTTSGYSYYGCRCPLCRAANTEACMRRRKARGGEK